MFKGDEVSLFDGFCNACRCAQVDNMGYLFTRIFHTYDYGNAVFNMRHPYGYDTSHPYFEPDERIALLVCAYAHRTQDANGNPEPRVEVYDFMLPLVVTKYQAGNKVAAAKKLCHDEIRMLEAVRMSPRTLHTFHNFNLEQNGYTEWQQYERNRWDNVRQGLIEHWWDWISDPDPVTGETVAIKQANDDMLQVNPHYYHKHKSGAVREKRLSLRGQRFYSIYSRGRAFLPADSTTKPSGMRPCVTKHFFKYSPVYYLSASVNIYVSGEAELLCIPGINFVREE